MPAFLQSFIEAEQERSRRIEQLRKEIREFAKEEAGSSITEQILLFLADEMVEHLSEIDYELRMKFELYITPLIKRTYIYRYTGTFDRIRQAYIRERMKTPAGQRECEWKYKNEILFVPYHSDPVIVKSVETVRCRSNMVWNFKAAASEKLKRQIFTVLEYILENYEISRLREYKLTGLQLFYEFCIREQITDIQLLKLEQETAFQDYLKQKVEKEQRRKRLKSIVETARKVIFIETDETRWDATIWYLERFRIAKERINQSDSIEKISFQEVLQPKNRLLLQEYMKYEIGIGELALSTVYERFRTIRNFLQEISELEIFEAVEDVIADIIEAIKTVLEETPPELVGDIYENGVLMAGGGAMLGGLRKLVERTLQVKCVVAKDAIHCVAKGTAIAFRKMDTLLDGFENIAVYQFK